MPRFNQVFVSELTVAKRESDKQLIVAQCVVAHGRCSTLTPPPHRVRRNFVADRLPLGRDHRNARQNYKELQVWKLSGSKGGKTLSVVFQ